MKLSTLSMIAFSLGVVVIGPAINGYNHYKKNEVAAKHLKTEIKDFRSELKDSFMLNGKEVENITDRVESTRDIKFFRDSLINVQKIKKQSFEQGKQFFLDSIALAKQGIVK